MSFVSSLQCSVPINSFRCGQIMAGIPLCTLMTTLIGLLSKMVTSESLNVSLVMMSGWDNKSDYSRIRTAPVIAATVEVLNKEYAGRLFFTTVSAVPPDVLTCERLTSRAAFIATEYFYRKGGRNQTMVFLGPDCSAAVDIVGLVSRSESNDKWPLVGHIQKWQVTFQHFFNNFSITLFFLSLEKIGDVKVSSLWLELKL